MSRTEPPQGAHRTLYLVLDKSKANLAMARDKLAAIEKTLTI